MMFLLSRWPFFQEYKILFDQDLILWQNEDIERIFENHFGLCTAHVHCSKLWWKFTSSVWTKADWSIRLLSIFRVAISLTITAHLKPSSECFVSRTCFSKVVFPAPRNPHNNDTGRRSSPVPFCSDGFVEGVGYCRVRESSRLECLFTYNKSSKGAFTLFCMLLCRCYFGL